jgi:short-subunit dehydrogenase
MANEESRPVALISGASSGIGAAIATSLVEHGYRVFGTARNPEKSAKVAGVEMLPLDVRSQPSAQECVATVLDRAGHIDVLVNNAGSALIGAAEESSDAEIAAQFDVNFFGLVRVTRAVLPSMRERRRGHIVNIGSLAGRVAIPFMAFYSATKAAIEGYSEALLHELRPFGIHVSIVEPGFIHTELAGHSASADMPIAAYDPWREAATKSIEHQIETSPEASVVAKSVLDAVQSKNPRLRYRSGTAKTILFLRGLFPDSMFFPVIRKRFDLNVDPSRAAVSRS